MSLRMTEKDAERFWKKVERGRKNQCWPWKASRTPAGYGQFGVQGRIMGAHRVAFYLEYGYWPEVARHKCDNPVCCNPYHIIDGTQAENVQDMMERGRWRAPGFGASQPVYTPVPDRPAEPVTGLRPRHATMGELHPQAVLSDSAIRYIREKYANDEMSQTALADKFGVTQVWIGQVCRGERRLAAGGPIVRRGKGGRSWISASQRARQAA